MILNNLFKNKPKLEKNEFISKPLNQSNRERINSLPMMINDYGENHFNGLDVEIMAELMKRHNKCRSLAFFQ